MRPAQQRNQNQVTFIPWLINEINTGHHRGLEWIDASQKIAGIPWPRAKENLPMEELGVIYCWHKYRFGDNYNQSKSPSTLKGTFRAIINSRDEITKLRDEENMIHIQINCTVPDSQKTPVASPSNDYLPSPSQPGMWPNGHSSVNSSPILHGNGSVGSHSQSSRTSSWEGSPFDMMTAPSWAQEMLRQEQRVTDYSCNVFISVWSRGHLLCDKQADLQNGLLIYSDTSEVDFNMLTEEKCNETYGRGSRNADKLFISQTQTSGDTELYQALSNFSRGIVLSSDPFYNILVERLCAVRPYFGHSNHGGAKQMPRPKDQNWAINPVYSYISFLEMAGYLMNMKRVGRPMNESDRPTAITYIAVGKEWTPSKPIQELPLFIEIKHERANNFQQANLNFNQETNNHTSGIVVSITNSLDTRQSAAVEFDDQMLNDISSEMPDVDFEANMEFTEILRNCGVSVEEPLLS